MSSGERRGFSKSLSETKRKTAYVTLVKGYAGTDKYEKAIDVKLLSRLNKKELADTKHRLQEKLIEHLQQVDIENDLEQKVSDLIQKARMLKARGFYKESLQYFNKALKIAEQYELHLKIIEIEEMIALMSYKSPITSVEINQINESYRSIFQELANLNYYTVQCADLYRIIISNESNLESQINIDSQFDSEAQEDKFRLRSQYLQVKSQENREVLDRKEWWKICHEDYMLFNNNPQYIKEKPRDYLSSINNLVVNLIRAGKLEDIPLILDQIKKINFKEEKDSLIGMTAYFNLHIMHALNIEKATKIDQLIIEMDNFVSSELEETSYIFKLLEAYLGIFYIHFKNGDWEACWDTLNQIQTADLGTDARYERFIHLMDLMVVCCQYELEEIDLALNRFSNVSRTIKKHPVSKSRPVLLEYLACVKAILHEDKGQLKTVLATINPKQETVTSRVMYRYLAAKVK